jgi:DNA helicase-2/ATP-dependent DNA helicase PcrA
VVVQAPGGCGKTWQGADYARWLCPKIAPSRLLIVTHTHAACDVFAEKTRRFGSQVEIRTIDSLCAEIVRNYPPAAGAESLDFEGKARWAAHVLAAAPFVARALAQRYPVVICDEHQDASAEQHAVVMALHAAKARVRIFGDPMQLIYPGDHGGLDADLARWTAVRARADAALELSTPHRWRGVNEELGAWILEMRQELQAGRPLRLGGVRPRGLSVIQADNQAVRALGFQLEDPGRRQVGRMLADEDPLLVLCPHKKTGQFIRAASGRRLPIWEGHSRSAMPELAQALGRARSVAEVGEAVVEFCQEVCTGFSAGAFADRFRQELASGCVRPARGKFVALQAMAREIVEAPDHRGVGRMLRQLHAATRQDDGFSTVHIDYPQEFWEAARLADHEHLQAALDHQVAKRRGIRRLPPLRAISTVHKAKGLEAQRVLVMPCEEATFREKDRRLLYVALSRATRALTLVVSPARPGPWISFAA